MRPRPHLYSLHIKFLIFSLLLLSNVSFGQRIILPFFPDLPDAVWNVDYSLPQAFEAVTIDNVAGTLTPIPISQWDWATRAAEPHLESDIGIVLLDNGDIDPANKRVQSSHTCFPCHVTVTATPSDGSAVITQEFTLVVRPTSPPPCPATQEVVLVLDASGSMNASPGGVSRWSQLRQAVFDYLPDLYNLPDIDDSDLLRVIVFQGPSANVRSFFNGTFGDVDWNDQADIDAQLFQRTESDGSVTVANPAGATPMGEGVRQALASFSSTANSRNIIVFSDGHENQTPRYDHLTNFIGTLDLNTAPENEVKIFTIGVAHSDEAELQALANPDLTSSSGQSLFAHAYQPAEMNFLFTSSMPAAFRGCSPRLLDFRLGELLGQGTTIREKFKVDSLVKHLAFRLIIKSPVGTLDDDFQLSKNGIPVPFEGRFDRKSLKYYIDLPHLQDDSTFLDAGGEWELSFSGTKQTSYEITAMAEDKYLQTTLDLKNNNQRFYAGDDISLSAKVSLAGEPIEGVTIVGTLLRPGEDWRDFVARTAIDPRLLNPLENVAPTGVDRGSYLLAQAKIDSLFASPEFLAQLEREQRIVTFSHIGNGEYEASFSGSENNVTGTYQLLARYDGAVKGLGPFEGFETKWVHLDFARPVDINADENFIQGLTIDGVTQYLIQLKPTNRFGKFLGPGQAQRISVRVAGGEPINLVDKLDGSYEGTVYIPENTNPNVSIFIIDEKEPVVTRQINGTGFGLSLHTGGLYSLNNTSPLDSLQSGFYWEADISYRLSSKFDLQLIGGQYRFDNNYAITGGGLFLDYTFANNPLNGFYPRVAAGLGIYKPDGQSTTFGFGVRGGLIKNFGANLEIGAEVGIFSLPTPNYVFGFGGLNLKYFF